MFSFINLSVHPLIQQRRVERKQDDYKHRKNYQYESHRPNYFVVNVERFNVDNKRSPKRQEAYFEVGLIEIKSDRINY